MTIAADTNHDNGSDTMVCVRPSTEHRERIRLVSLRVIAGTMGPQRAELTLDIDGMHKSIVHMSDNGPVDAIFNAIKQLVPHTAELWLYQVHSIAGGRTDVPAKVTVRLEENDRTFTAVASDVDTLVASAKAYLIALNKLIARNQV